MDKRDIFPILIKDFLEATSDWSDSEIGSYFRLLVRQWRDGYIPKDEAKLSKIAFSFAETKNTVMPKFQEIESGLQNAKAERVREIWIRDFQYKPKRIKVVKEKQVKNIDEEFKKRREEFAETLKPLIDNPYSRELLLEFYEYWTEPNRQKTQFRKEMQKTWDLERRLKTWSKNNFNNGTIKRNTALPRYAGNQSDARQLAEATRQHLEQRKEQFD